MTFREARKDRRAFRRACMAIVMGAFLVGIQCSREPEKKEPDVSSSIGNVALLVFSADDQTLLGTAEPFPLPADTPVASALDALGRHLEKTFFSRGYGNQPSDIHFNVERIDYVPIRKRHLRIGTINMVDKDRVAVESFFQGSRGAQTTFCMLTATFLQPHLDPPLLDGLVLLYNGETLTGLDHIDLTGVLTPRLVQTIVYRAIYAAGR